MIKKHTFIYYFLLLLCMQKRGQITIFIIIGILILFISALFLYLNSEVTEKKLDLEDSEVTKFSWAKPALQSYVEECIEETVEPSIYLLASQGGVIYDDGTSNILFTENAMVNYAWLNGVNGILVQKMENDLEIYLEENIHHCLFDYSTFDKQNVEVVPDYENIEADIVVSNEYVNVNLKLPHTMIFLTEDTQTLDTFTTKLKSPLGKLAKEAQFVSKTNQNDLQLNQLLDLDYLPTIFPYDEKTTIFSVVAIQEYNDKDLTFFFAIRNDFPENKPPKLHTIHDKTFRVGDKWEEDFFVDDSNNELLTFTLEPNEFGMLEDGTIETVMQETGSWDLILTVEDSGGLKDTEQFTVTVLEMYEVAVELVSFSDEEFIEYPDDFLAIPHGYEDEE